MKQESINIASEPKKKTGNGIRIALITLSLLTVASIGGLAYTIFSSNTQKNQLENQVKSTKEELVKANEVVSK